MDVIHKFGVFKPEIHIERQINENEKQILHFKHTQESWIGTETGDNISVFGRDENNNTIEIEMPVSVDILIRALRDYKGDTY